MSVWGSGVAGWQRGSVAAYYRMVHSRKLGSLGGTEGLSLTGATSSGQPRGRRDVAQQTGMAGQGRAGQCATDEGVGRRVLSATDAERQRDRKT